MKKLAIFLLVIIAIVVISPKFISTIVVDERLRIINQLNETEGIEVSSKDYSPHWFGAQSSLEITLQLAQEGLGDITIVVDEVLSFGPVILTDDDWYIALGHSKIDFRSSGVLIDDEIMTFINEKVHLSAVLTLTNNIVAQIKTDQVSFEDGNTQFIAKSSSGQFSLINKKDLIGELSWGGLELKSSDGDFDIGAVAMETQQSLVSGKYLEGTAILSGDTEFKVDHINYSDIAGSEIFSLQALLFTTSVTINNGLLAIHLAYGADKIVSVGQTVTQPNLDIILANIDIDALQELNVLLASLPTNFDEQALSTEASKEIAKLADKFLAKDPSLKVTDISVITEQGKIASDVNLQIDKDRFDSENLMSVMSALNAEAKGNAPVEFFTQFGLIPIINNFVELGYLIKQDNILSFEAEYSRAQLKVNGKVLQY
jgi:hypothetical protein